MNAAFDFVSVRAGMQNFNSDFRGYLFADNQLGVRLFGNAAQQPPSVQHRVTSRCAIATPASQLHKFSSREQRVIIANYYIQDFGAPRLHRDVQPAREPRREAEPRSVAPQQVTYVGFHGDGRWGAWSVSHAFYQAFGTDSNSAIVRQITPGASPELKISAQMAAIELSRDADWLRYRFSAFYASGDDAIGSRHGDRFDTITDNPNLAGGQFMYWIAAEVRGRRSADRRKRFPRSSACCRICASKFSERANFVNPGLMLVNGGVDMRLSAGS